MLDIAWDSSLNEGAHNAVFTCLKVQPHERVVILTDRERLPIGGAMHAAVQKTGAECEFFVIEDYAERPATRLTMLVIATRRPASSRSAWR